MKHAVRASWRAVRQGRDVLFANRGEDVFSVMTEKVSTSAVQPLHSLVCMPAAVHCSVRTAEKQPEKLIQGSI